MVKRLAVWALLAGGCLPEPGAPPSLISGPRVLAIASEPAEARPGDAVALRALVVDAGGALAAADLAWAFCTAPKPPTEENSVSRGCLDDGFSPISGLGPSAMAALPAESCTLFGPLPPPQRAGEPPPRPRDADLTGGYYQPVRARLGGLTAIALVRVGCGVAGVPLEVAAQYRARYQPNRNPRIAALGIEQDGRTLAPEALPAGAQVHLRLRLAAGSSERYVVVDPATQSLSERDEALSVSWFATAGAVLRGRTPATDIEGETDLALPPVPGTLSLWAVLRDSRGGVDYASFTLSVR